VYFRWNIDDKIQPGIDLVEVDSYHNRITGRYLQQAINPFICAPPQRPLVVGVLRGIFGHVGVRTYPLNGRLQILHEETEDFALLYTCSQYGCIFSRNCRRKPPVSVCVKHRKTAIMSFKIFKVIQGH